MPGMGGRVLPGVFLCVCSAGSIEPASAFLAPLRRLSGELVCDHGLPASQQHLRTCTPRSPFPAPPHSHTSLCARFARRVAAMRLGSAGHPLPAVPVLPPLLHLAGAPG